MKIRFVTFDAAGTLVRVRWNPGGLATECLTELGHMPPLNAPDLYHNLLRRRHHDFLEMNLAKDEVLSDAFWLSLTGSWLAELGVSQVYAQELLKLGHEKMYGEGSEIFQLYDDVLPCLNALSGDGFRLAVISNWDISLHRVLRMLGIHSLFEYVCPSLEFGVEKPHPRLFEHVLNHLGASPSETLHIGDDPLDDLQGAQNARLHALLIDRERPDAQGAVLSSLLNLPEKIRSLHA